MAINAGAVTTSEQNEQIIRVYFEARSGWSVTKLDFGKGKAADFRICESTSCFLCEVKTIHSVRANFPFTPLDFYLEQRETRQDEIKKWMEENPDKQLILHPGEWSFIYGDEIEFTKKYRNRRRNTEKWFKEFAQTMMVYFASSRIKDLPYNLKLDSDDLYVPNSQERASFFKWLEDEIRAIDKGTPSRYWQIESSHFGRAALYSVFYQIHTPIDENDIESVYQLMVEGPFEAGTFEINIHSYGGLNLDAITSNVEAGLKQLEKSALREKDQQMPRIIVLGFESGLGFEWQQLESHITWLLKHNFDLSAIAVLDLTPDEIFPSQKEGLLAWIEFHAKTPRVPRFIVYHNPWLQDVKSLPINVFTDKWSVQLSPIK
jgi:hypothetical protein